MPVQVVVVLALAQVMVVRRRDRCSVEHHTVAPKSHHYFDLMLWYQL
jgi:hypothetical protein